MNLILQPDGWRPPKGYSNGISATGRFVFVSGQIGWNAQHDFESDDLVAQVKQALSNIVSVLAAGGAKPEHAMSLTWYFTDKAEYVARHKEIGEAYRAVMGKHFPTMIGAGVGTDRNARQGGDPGNRGNSGLAERSAIGRGLPRAVKRPADARVVPLALTVKAAGDELNRPFSPPTTRSMTSDPLVESALVAPTHTPCLTPEATLYVDGMPQGPISTMSFFYVPAGIPITVSIRSPKCARAWDTTFTVPPGTGWVIGRRMARDCKP